MENKFYIDVTQEQANYLQRLGVELNGMVFLIDRIFSNHAGDTDTALFDSIPFKHYMKKYEEAFAAWDLAKKEFQDTHLTPIIREKTGKEDPAYNWSIEDYSTLICEVTLI